MDNVMINEVCNDMCISLTRIRVSCAELVWVGVVWEGWCCVAWSVMCGRVGDGWAGIYPTWCSVSLDRCDRRDIRKVVLLVGIPRGSVVCHACHSETKFNVARITFPDIRHVAKHDKNIKSIRPMPRPTCEVGADWAGWLVLMGNWEWESVAMGTRDRWIKSLATDRGQHAGGRGPDWADIAYLSWGAAINSLYAISWLHSHMQHTDSIVVLSKAIHGSVTICNWNTTEPLWVELGWSNLQNNVLTMWEPRYSGSLTIWFCC